VKQHLMGATALVLAVACLGPAQAQVAYTNSVLNGCYAHISTSVDNGSGTAKDVVGTFCFDGNGNIVGTSGTPGLSGATGNTDGKVRSVSNQTGTYSVTNSPGDGMGTFTIGCSTHAFAIRNVQSGTARGVSFMLVKRSGTCKSDPVDVIGGSAEYMGPLN
jgi:hypothetical protein